MKVLDLRCAHGHAFEGWFRSHEDFAAQREGGRLACPLCGHGEIEPLPSAPRLNLSGAREPGRGGARGEGPDAARGDAPAAARPGPGADGEAGSRQGGGAVRHVDLQAAWLRAVRELMARTEDVGQRFPEEVRRMHYGEAPERAIRGHATPEERAALRDEGIETVAIPVPGGTDGPLQ